jgi:hypothetical protein
VQRAELGWLGQKGRGRGEGWASLAFPFPSNFLFLFFLFSLLNSNEIKPQIQFELFQTCASTKNKV